MIKCKVVELNKNEYSIQREDGTYINTFHAQLGSIPMTWNKKYHTVKKVQELDLNVWSNIVF